MAALIDLDYKNEMDRTALFQGLQFLKFALAIDTDERHDTITIADPNNSKTKLLFDGDNLVEKNGKLTGGTITGGHIIVDGKEAFSLTGLHASAKTFNDAAAMGAQGLYTYFSDAMVGNVLATGDRFDNILEVGRGGKGTVRAGAGNDLINIWHQKNVVIDGGTGIDTIDFESYAGPTTPANGVARVDLAKGTGTNPFGGALSIKNVENVVNAWNVSSDLRGDGHNNLLVGGRHADTLMGRGGDDEIHIDFNPTAAARATVVYGGTGTDTLRANLTESPGAPMTGIGESLRFLNRLDLEHASLNTGTFHGGTFKDVEVFQVLGFLNKDVFDFRGSSAGETVLSAGSDDPLNGRGGNDILNGGGGADRLTGGSGADHFQYQFLSDSTVAVAGRDTIRDFSHAQHDKIDLHLMFPSQNFSGAYDFIGTKAFHGGASEVRYRHVGTDTFVYVDDNGDRKADMVIELDHGPAKLFANDFML